MFPDVRFLIVVFLTSVVLSPLAFGMVAAYLVTREPLSRPPGGTFLQTAMHAGTEQRASDAGMMAIKIPPDQPAGGRSVALQPPQKLNGNDEASVRPDVSAAAPAARATSADEAASTDNAAPALAAATLTESVLPTIAGAQGAITPAVAETAASETSRPADVTATIITPHRQSDTAPAAARPQTPPTEIAVAARQPLDAPEPAAAVEDIVASDRPLITGAIPTPRPKGFQNPKARARKTVRRPRPLPPAPQPSDPFAFRLGSGPS